MPSQRLVPWITEEARRFLADRFPIGGKVFEYGSGGSSIWFSERALTFTVEHNPGWIIKLRPLCSESWTPIVRPKPYASAIQVFNNNAFDCIMIDGRDRVACTFFAVPHLKSGGMLILDNSERKRYDHIALMLCDWQRYDFTQTVPDDHNFFYEGWTTSIWIKP